jgi:hypothetical protein
MIMGVTPLMLVRRFTWLCNGSSAIRISPASRSFAPRAYIIVHRALALTVISPVAGVAAVNSVPSPPGLIKQPPNVESVFIGARGSPPTVLMEGRAGTVGDIPLKDTEYETPLTEGPGPPGLS